jgi:hypothetical protein
VQALLRDVPPQAGSVDSAEQERGAAQQEQQQFVTELNSDGVAGRAVRGPALRALQLAVLLSAVRRALQPKERVRQRPAQKLELRVQPQPQELQPLRAGQQLGQPRQALLQLEVERGGLQPAGFNRAAFTAASFASFSALAFDSASASACACPWIVLRTFSATSTVTELECVFFSVTPKPGRRSMMALALTSSSRASSFIRT